MRKLGLLAALFLVWTALAQPVPTGSTCPYIVPNAVLTAAQWNYCFQIKQDNLNFTPLNAAGGTMTGPLVTFAPSAGGAGFNLPPGVSPGIFNNGDLWSTSAGLFVRVAGQTYNVVNPSIISITAYGVNFNTANTDNPISIVLPPGYSRYRISSIEISGASGSLSSSTFGVFTAVSAGGTAIVTSGTAGTITTGSENTNNNTQSPTINNTGTQSYTLGTLYFRVQNAQGVAAAANVTFHIYPLS
jgi:hypothetical protein